MFFPEHLLNKSGPLARVWLAANLEKKLSKNQVLQDKINDDIAVIVRPEVAGGPMALRLSGQLLLGVVRIYSRKARYLLDDCTEALMKIKMAFKPGNIDLPTSHSHIANPAALTLPDVITDLDLLAPMPDPNLILSQSLADLTNFGALDTTLPDWDNSQFLSESVEAPRRAPMLLDDADDLNLDHGDDLDPITFDEGPSIEVGRNAPLELQRGMSEERDTSPKLFEEDDLGLDFGDNDDTTAMPAIGDTNLGIDMDLGMGDTTADLGVPVDDVPQEMEGIDGAAQGERERDTVSPLSSIRSSVERDLEETIAQDQNATAFQPDQEEEQEEAIRQPQRAKRRKLLHADAQTQLSVNEIRQQQNDHSKILKPSEFLPRDPMLLALMNMQKSGGFVSGILGDGRSRGWAPELKGILSLELVSRPAQKRKRDSGVADVGSEGEDQLERTPQLEFEHTEPELDAFGADIGDTSIAPQEEMVELHADEGIVPMDEEQLEDEAFSPADNFDDTTAPLLHPADSGPISVGTKHAVHLLRERFGAEAESNESERQKASVLFQDMLPEETTTRADATKMFFEVLVLATKDAIKVEQSRDELGGPLRIRGKRGLWGSWAETSAGGELASQNTVEAAPAVAAEA
ncbi:hypothetical protein M011DRAFT_490377 [Sporormia fimetaria CBS 119925]|uniref:Double-strand-break repair protein rad21 n=1 Tax=Sporormia fimetaria CBS 119925 TaxID=1340428 RepID=A0A6A6UYZ0_9PLEO|nr:hypothetical protein M011DRAFT_490377 [Sporormia fimetaria CBS 119925]